MFEGSHQEKRLSSQEQHKSFNADRIIQLTRIAEQKKERTTKNKERWERRKAKIYDTAMATLMFVASHLVSGIPTGAGTTAEREWEKSVSVKEAAAAMQSKEEREATEFKLKMEFMEKCSQFVVESPENLSKEEYWLILSRYFSPEGIRKINAVLRSMEVQSSGNDESKMPKNYQGQAEQKAAEVTMFSNGDRKMVFFDQTIKQYMPYEEATVFYHELGHIIDPGGSKKSSIDWEHVIATSSKPISKYAAEYPDKRNQRLEDFADAVEALFLYPEYFAEEDPTRFEAIRQHMREFNNDPAWDSRQLAPEMAFYFYNLEKEGVEKIEDDEY